MLVSLRFEVSATPSRPSVCTRIINGKLSMSVFRFTGFYLTEFVNKIIVEIRSKMLQSATLAPPTIHSCLICLLCIFTFIPSFFVAKFTYLQLEKCINHHTSTVCSSQTTLGNSVRGNCTGDHSIHYECTM